LLKQFSPELETEAEVFVTLLINLISGETEASKPRPGWMRMEIPFSHQLPRLLQKPAPPPTRITSHQVHAIPDRLSQAPIQPLSLDSQRADIKRDLTSEAPQVAAPTGSPRIRDSSNTDDAIPCPTILKDAAVLFSTIPDIPQPQEADTCQRRVLLDTGQHLIRKTETPRGLAAANPSQRLDHRR
jgi:hypothetical protein